VTVTAIPTVEDLVADLCLIGNLPPATASDLLRDAEIRIAQYHAVRDALLIRAVAGNGVALDRKKTEGDRLLSVTEVAKRIDKSRSWIEANLGELPEPLRVGGERRWSERELEQWMERRPRWSEP
jgi:predicted DNA-binding transcriptional regulator AlpA